MTDGQTLVGLPPARLTPDADPALIVTVAWRRQGKVEYLDLPRLLRTAALVLKNQQRAGRRQQRTAGRLPAQPEQVVPDPSADHAGSAHIAQSLQSLSPSSAPSR